MGKIYSPLAGNLVGRVGSTVYRKGQDATVASQYQPQVANPKTRAQSIVRCAFSTATAAMSAMKFIADHSFEGVRGKRANLQRFIKLNQKLIASDIKAAFEGTGSDEMAGMVNIKGVPYVQPYPYVLSQGSLSPFGVTTLAEDGLIFPVADTSVFSDTINTQAEYEAALASIGLAPGDELAIVSVLSSGSAARIRTSGGLCDNFLTHAAAARVTFKANLPSSFEGEIIVNHRINPALIERSAGTLNITVKQNELELAVVADGELVGSAAIRSALDPSGKYLYSPATLIISEDAYEASHFVVESYEASFAGGDGSDYYLDNPARVEGVGALPHHHCLVRGSRPSLEVGEGLFLCSFLFDMYKSVFHLYTIYYP